MFHVKISKCFFNFGANIQIFVEISKSFYAKHVKISKSFYTKHVEFSKSLQVSAINQTLFTVYAIARVGLRDVGIMSCNLLL